MRHFLLKYLTEWSVLTHLSTGGSWGLVTISLWPLEARLPLSATERAKSLELPELVERLLLDMAELTVSNFPIKVSDLDFRLQTASGKYAGCYYVMCAVAREVLMVTKGQ